MDEFLTGNNTNVDVEESVRKILLMGITDEEKIRNTLKLTNYDINETITMICCGNEAIPVGIDNTSLDAETVNKVVANQNCTQSALDPLEKLVVGHDVSFEFSSLEFSRLQTRVHTDQWDIPCRRAQSFGLCLLGSIHELRKDGLAAFEITPDIRHFVCTCVVDCVTKLVTSQAVFNWDRDTLEGVHNMLELAVRLICEYFTAFKQGVLDEMKELNVEPIDNSKQHTSEPDRKPNSFACNQPLKTVAQFRMELLRLLALIFDCETNYHQSCRDRSSSTGTYADPFNDWTSIAVRKLNSETVFAETLPSPKNFYLVNLINCFGVYGGFQLFKWIGTQPWIGINLISALLLPIANCADYLTELPFGAQQLGPVVVQRAFWMLSNLCEDDFKDRDSRIFDLVASLRVLAYRLSDLSSLRPDATPVTLAKDVQGFQINYSSREPDWRSLAASDSDVPISVLSASFSVGKVDKLHCTLLLAALSPPQGAGGASFNGRMLAMRNLVEQLQASKVVGDPDRNDAEHVSARRRSFAYSANLLASENAAFLVRRVRRRTLRQDLLMTWFRESEVIRKSMHNLDNTAYMNTLGQLFRLLGEKITADDLSIVWQKTTNQNGAALDNILSLLADVASTKLIQFQLDHLFDLVEMTWTNLDRLAQLHASSQKSSKNQRNSDKTNQSHDLPCDEPSHIRHGRARLLNLVGRIGVTTKEPRKADLCVELLWQLAHGNYSRVTTKKETNVQRLKSGSMAVNANSGSIEYRHPEPIEAALAQQLVILREFRCSGVDQRIRAMRWLNEAVQHIKKNVLTFFMLAYVKSLLELILKNFVGKAKRDSLQELIRSHDLVTEVVTSLLRYEQRAIRSHGDLLTADSLDELGFRHSDVVRRHFELLHYLLRNAELNLNVERAKSLWESLIVHPRVAVYDREQCFVWFTASLSHLEPESQAALFTKLVLKSNPALFRSFAGFECFKTFFQKVNLHEGRMKEVSKGWHVEKPDLVGLDFLWDIYLSLPSVDASLEGMHMKDPIISPLSPDPPLQKAGTGRKESTQVTTTSSMNDPAGAQSSDSAAPERIETNAVKLARQLLLDVHWGQLAPRLRRDPEACYRRFFDACRRRLEANWSIGRGSIPKRGIHSALAETGQLLAALVIGPGPAGRAKHCSRTAARLALRRLIGLVCAYIKTVEDELFGPRIQHPTWRPHATTFRGWELCLPLRVETLKPGQAVPVPVTLIGGGRNVNNTFSPLETSSRSSESCDSISLLVHSNEMLGSVRNRTNLISTALLFASHTEHESVAAQGATNFPNWSASALYLGAASPPDGPSRRKYAAQSTIVRSSSSYLNLPSIEPAHSTGEQKHFTIDTSHPKRLLETVLNRNPVGEMGFQNGRQLTVRLIAALNGRSSTRPGRLTTSPNAVSGLTMSLCSACPSVASLSGPSTSEADLVARAAAALSTGTDEHTRRSVAGEPPLYAGASMQRQRSRISVEGGIVGLSSSGGSSVQLTHGLSVLSLNSHVAVASSLIGSANDVSTANTSLVPDQGASVINTKLPSLCLSEDPSVYELLIELAEAELAPASTFPSLARGEEKRPHEIQVPNMSFASSFSLIHPVRLLLGALATYRPASFSQTGSHLQHSLFCSPTTLLKSTPYRTLYKLQILSAAFIPVDASPWWDFSPGCLLLPSRDRGCFASLGFPMHVAEETSLQMSAGKSSNMFDIEPQYSSSSPSNSDAKLIMSTDSLLVGHPSDPSASTSAPSSPAAKRKKNLRLFSTLVPQLDDVSFRSKLFHKRSSGSHSALGLVANVPLIEFIEPLVRLLERLIPPKSGRLSTRELFPHLPVIGAYQVQSCLSANVAWWRREVRHLCLQLLAFLLNPLNLTNCNGTPLQPNQSPEAELPVNHPLLVRLTPPFVSVLLNSLLETAVLSSGTSDTSPAHQTEFNHPTTKQSTTIPVYQPHKDTRAGIAGVIEVKYGNGRTLFYQDVEVAVQSLHLMFQCVMAYPTRFLDSFLSLERLEEKLLHLLVYSPSSRVRAETARQLEQLSLVTSRYLRFGEPCVRDWDLTNQLGSANLDPDNTTECLCATHNHISHPNLLRFLLRILFQSRLPFYTTRLDLEPPSTTVLLVQSPEYFHVRGFLVGQTPACLLKRWFGTDQITILQEEISWFRRIMGIEMNFAKSKRALTDCMLAGHLESARLLCAQAVACVISFVGCTLSGSVATASPNFDLQNKPGQPIRSGLGDRRITVPTVLMDALTNRIDEMETDESGAMDERESPGDKCVPVQRESSDNCFPIDSTSALNVATKCLRIAREFVHFLITECLFPAASHVLLTSPLKSLSRLPSTLEASLSSLRALDPLSLRVSNLLNKLNSDSDSEPVTPSTHTVLIMESMGLLTRQTSFNFLILVSRMDVFSLERVVDLLILLHHNQDPIHSDLGSFSSTGPTSVAQTPENISGRSSPKLSIAGATETSVKSRSDLKGFIWDIHPHLNGRSESGFVGLRNGGATCYMNAVLQQLFMQPGLAEAVLSITDTDDLDEGNILFQTQRLFGYLLESQLEYYDPVGFWKSFRLWDTDEPVNPREQQDAFDFFQAILDQLDEELKKLKREPFFQAVYQGIFLDSKFCDECEHRYDREEVFSAINLAVKASDLLEALNQFVRGEVLDGDNRYYCERCRVKRRTVKRLSIHTLPPVLCLHLKRFDFDWDRQIPVKFSNHFTFPRELDMTPYMADSVQKLRPEAFLSPNSSTSSLLQREARGKTSFPVTKPFQLSDNELGMVDDSNREDLGSDVSKTLQLKEPAPAIAVSEENDEKPAPTRAAFTLDVPDVPNAAAPPNNTSPVFPSPHTQYIYQLVGIVVHSGQANSGHYYAFIKDRGRGESKSELNRNIERRPRVNSLSGRLPSDTANSFVKASNELRQKGLKKGKLGTFEKLRSGSIPSGDAKSTPVAESNQSGLTETTETEERGGWYRFNDTCVEPVELTDELLEQECFGGTYKVASADGKTFERRTRFWSAYLLFYERIDLNHAALRRYLTTGKRSVDLGNPAPHHHSLASASLSQYAGVVPSLVFEKPTASVTEHEAFGMGINSPGDNADNVQYVQPASGHTRKSLGINRPQLGRLLEWQPNRPEPHLTGATTCPMPRRIANQIWAENWEFLRNRNVYSQDYFHFVRELCEGILADSSSLRHEPQRGVMGTRLLAYFLFTTFISLHPRVKAMVSGVPGVGASTSMRTLRDVSIRLNSEWLSLLTRLASTSPKACRWFMHFLCTTPTQPCLIPRLLLYLLLVPVPATRQQLANLLLSILRAFYSFKETNILDGTLTGLINRLLNFLDSGVAAENASEAGPLFALLRAYAEMCPHACLHLVNLRITTRLMNYLMKPATDCVLRNGQLDRYLSQVAPSSLSVTPPTWADKLRVWTPAQQHEMGNLYYLLCFLILQTSFEEYRTVKVTQTHSDSTFGAAIVGSQPQHSTRSGFRGRLSLRLSADTVAWLGLPPSRQAVQQQYRLMEKAVAHPSPQSFAQPSAPISPEEKLDDSSYLVGLFRLTEVLIRAYLENPATPKLVSSANDNEALNSGSTTTKSTHFDANASTNVAAIHAASTTCILGATEGVNVKPVSNTTEDGSIPLRQLVRDALLHITLGSWEASACLICALLLRISNRPQSELRHLFDLMSELLRVVDPLQMARIAACMDGMSNRPCTDSGHQVWCPRPQVDPKLWAWSPTELEVTEIKEEVPSTASNGSSNDEDLSELSASQDEEPTPDSYPPSPKGILELIAVDASRDSRRAYQCMKFVVQLSSESDAVMSYISRFPERWEPAVKWLENLMESSDDTQILTSVQACHLNHTSSVQPTDETESEGLYMVASSRQGDRGQKIPGLTEASNESDENEGGFQRTVSALTTLREATRLLFTMPRPDAGVGAANSNLSTPKAMFQGRSSGMIKENRTEKEMVDEDGEKEEDEVYGDHPL